MDRDPAALVRLRVAQRIRLLRLLRGWSQERFAEACAMHRSYVGAVERAERNLTLDSLVRIAAALDVPLEALVSEHPPDWSGWLPADRIREPHVGYVPAVLH